MEFHSGPKSLRLNRPFISLSEGRPGRILHAPGLLFVGIGKSVGVALVVPQVD